MVSGCDGSVSRVRGCATGDAVHFMTGALGTLLYSSSSLYPLSRSGQQRSYSSASLERLPGTLLESRVRGCRIRPISMRAEAFFRIILNVRSYHLDIFYSVAWKLRS